MTWRMLIVCLIVLARRPARAGLSGPVLAHHLWCPFCDRMRSPRRRPHPLREVQWECRGCGATVDFVWTPTPRGTHAHRHRPLPR